MQHASCKITHLTNILTVLLFQEWWLICPNGRRPDGVPAGGHRAGRGPVHLPGVLLSPHSHGLFPGGHHVRGQIALWGFAALRFPPMWYSQNETDYITILMLPGLGLIRLVLLVAWQPRFLFACVTFACLQSCGAFSHQSALRFSAGFAGVHVVGLSHHNRRRCHMLGMLVSQMVNAYVPCKIREKQDA